LDFWGNVGNCGDCFACWEPDQLGKFAELVGTFAINLQIGWAKFVGVNDGRIRRLFGLADNGKARKQLNFARMQSSQKRGEQGCREVQFRS
jgi:hypothetical protein